MKFSRHIYRSFSEGFTLIELLIVIAVVAILAVVIVLTLNPAELLKQSRDSNRLSEMSTLNSALGIFSTDVGPSMGSSSKVYISIPDTSATCANLGLRTLPTGWTYSCVTQANSKNTNGTGWLPVNFSLIATGSPLGGLPIDPLNSTSSQNYYTYTTSNGSWQITSHLESQKYIPQEARSGGTDPTAYTLGTNLSLAPFVGGLVGYWSFEDGNNITTSDSSGYGLTGTWHGNSPNHYVTGRVGTYAAYFDGSSDYITTTAPPPVTTANNISYSFWHLPAGVGNSSVITTSQRLIYAQTGSVAYRAVGIASVSYTRTNSGIWEHVVITNSNVSPVTTNIYVNGVLRQTGAVGKGNAGGSSNPVIGSSYSLGTELFSGYIDDMRIYDHILTSAEVQGIYSQN